MPLATATAPVGSLPRGEAARVSRVVPEPLSTRYHNHLHTAAVVHNHYTNTDST